MNNTHMNNQSGKSKKISKARREQQEFAAKFIPALDYAVKLTKGEIKGHGDIYEQLERIKKLAEEADEDEE